MNIYETAAAEEIPLMTYLQNLTIPLDIARNCDRIKSRGYMAEKFQ